MSDTPQPVEAAAQPASFQSLFTVPAANEGRNLTLNGPDGKPTPHWIRVRGADSDAFKAAERELRRGIIGYVEDNDGNPDARKKPEYQQLTDRLKLDGQVALVKAWSFAEPCTVENVKLLFAQAPYIADQVDTFAGKRELFVSV